MAVKEHHIRVRVSRRIQQDEYEPFEILFEEIVIMDEPANAKKVRRSLYNKMVKQLDSLIDKRFEE